MLKKICALVNKHREVVLYLFFGVLTTVVNYIVYIPLHNGASMLASVANILAWIVAVLFAFVTNKPFVFRSNDWSFKCVFPEFLKFLSGRISSLVIETIILAVTVDILRLNGLFMKVITSILVVVINYFFSKFLVFKKTAEQ